MNDWVSRRPIVISTLVANVHMGFVRNEGVILTTRGRKNPKDGRAATSFVGPSSTSVGVVGKTWQSRAMVGSPGSFTAFRMTLFVAK
jgi:hypothetical protein